MIIIKCTHDEYIDEYKFTIINVSVENITVKPPLTNTSEFWNCFREQTSYFPQNEPSE